MNGETTGNNPAAPQTVTGQGSSQPETPQPIVSDSRDKRDPDSFPTAAGPGQNPHQAAGKPAAANGKSRRHYYIPLIVVIAAVAVGVWLWYRNYSRYISTDDAKLNTYNYNVSARIGGRIVRILVDQGDTVRAGQLLAMLDSAQLYAQKMVYVSAVAQAQASLEEARQRLAYNRQSQRMQELSASLASDNYRRAREQYDGGVIAEEQYQQLRNASQVADVGVEAARVQVQVALSQIALAQAQMTNARAQIDLADSELTENYIYAPIDGVVLKRWKITDEVVSPGQSIVTVADNDDLWVEVFLEETKFQGIRDGQPAELHIDAYPRERFHGRVYLIGTAAASEFALIPPSNASGNFTKVTQRIPLRISIDSTSSGKPVSGFRLVGGMSVEAKIVRDR